MSKAKKCLNHSVWNDQNSFFKGRKGNSEKKKMNKISSLTKPLVIDMESPETFF